MGRVEFCDSLDSAQTQVHHCINDIYKLSKHNHRGYSPRAKRDQKKKSFQCENQNEN